jgi:hypothetical protein
VGLRPTNNKVAGTKIGRPGHLLVSSVFHFVSFFFDPIAAAGICELASK